MIRTLTASAIALAALTGLSAAASAETVSVSYADLNLSSDAGVTALNHRVAAAVTTVCGETGSRELSEARFVASCRKTARTNASQQVSALLDMKQRSAARETSFQVASR